MPDVVVLPRAALCVTLAFSGSMLAGACASHRSASGLCATIQRSRPVFDPTRAQSPKRLIASLAAFDRIGATAPAPVATDLATISSFVRGFLLDPTSTANNQDAVANYRAATHRVDVYFVKTCGLTVPTRPRFNTLTTVTTNAPD